jgi:hypothetical protein
MSSIDWDMRAGQVWPSLTKAAREGRKPTYGELAREISTSARAVGRALDPIQDFCRAKKLPPLTWIVVNARGEVGSGVDAEGEAQLQAGRERVFSHSWDEMPNPFLTREESVAQRAVQRTRNPPGSLYVVHPPSRRELEEAWLRFDRDWGVVIETLYGLCQECPDDASRRRTTGKFILINRVYNARLEAKIEPPVGSRAVEVIGSFLETHADAVHEIIAAIPVGEKLTSPVVEVVVRQHGLLAEMLACELSRGASMRSFASKYLHFHRPLVPIYDSQCAQALRWRVAGVVRSPAQTGLDPDYSEFCARFLALYEDCIHRGLDVTVKRLDALLWQLPKKARQPLGGIAT